MTPFPPSNSENLLEQAHLAMIRGHTQEAQTLLNTLLDSDPNNEPAQAMRDTLLAQEVSQVQATPPDTWDFITPPPLSSPRQPTRRVPWYLLLPACFAAGYCLTFARGRHTHYATPLTLHEHLIFGALAGVCLFIITRTKTY